MNFPMFSCSHFFRSNRKQSAMLKRGQEGIPGEGSAIWKPKSMNLVMAKPRPTNLVPHNVLSMKRSPPQELSDSNNPGNAQTGQRSVLTGIWKQRRDTGRNPAEHSQVWQQDGSQIAESWKQEKKSESSHSTGTKKLVRGVDPHKNRSETKFRNMKIPSRHYLKKIYQKMRIKLGTTQKLSKFGTEAMKTDVLMWGLFISSSTKAAIHFAPRYTENLEAYKNTDFAEIQNLFCVTHT